MPEGGASLAEETECGSPQERSFREEREEAGGGGGGDGHTRIYRLAMCATRERPGAGVGAHLMHPVKACEMQAEDGLGLTGLGLGRCGGRRGRRKGSVSPGRARDQGARTRAGRGEVLRRVRARAVSGSAGRLCPGPRSPAPSPQPPGGFRSSAREGSPAPSSRPRDAQAWSPAGPGRA